MSERFKPYATVALIIEHNGKYLIVEEYNEDQNNRLVFGNPCGHIDGKETILEAAKREGYEETGAEVEILNLISRITKPFTDSVLRQNSKKYHKTLRQMIQITRFLQSNGIPKSRFMQEKTVGELALWVRISMITLQEKDTL